MANNLQLNRRLLLAILRAPSSHALSRSQISRQPLTIRPISTSSRWSAPPSVSFGEETDQLIAALEPNKSQTRAKKPREAAVATSKGNMRKEPKRQFLRQLSEHLDDIEEREKKQKEKKNKSVKADTTTITGRKDNRVKSSRAGTIASKGKKAQNFVPVMVETNPPTSIAKDRDVYGEPILLEIPDPTPTSDPTSEITRDTKLKSLEQKRSDRPSRVSKSRDTLSSSDSVSHSTSLRPPGAEPWQIQKHALKTKFAEGWQPRKKISPDTLTGIRSLHERDPEKFSTENLARQFEISPEAIRRILRTKWGMTPEQMEERRQRWARRHDRIWDHKAELGQRPKRTRDKKIEGPEKFEELILQKQALGEM